MNENWKDKMGISCTSIVCIFISVSREWNRHIYQIMGFNFDDENSSCKTAILTARRTMKFRANLLRIADATFCTRLRLLLRLLRVSRTQTVSIQSGRPEFHHSDAIRSLSCRSFRPRGLPLFSTFRRKRILARQTVSIKVTQQQSSLNSMKFRSGGIR